MSSTMRTIMDVDRIYASRRRRSVVEQPRLPQRGERLGRIRANSSYPYRSPGRISAGRSPRSEPVAMQRRSASGAWTRVVSDLGSAGWVKTSALCS
jgi:hypothetical protein